MRKTVGLVLLGLAGFLVTAALLALLWVPGQVKKTPLDVDTTTRLTGNAAVLPTGPGAPVKAVSHSVADGAASDSEVVVFDTFSCVVQDPDGTAPDCVDDTDPDKRLVTAGTDRFATTGSPPWPSTTRSTSARRRAARRARQQVPVRRASRRPTRSGTASSAAPSTRPSRARRTSTGSPPTSSSVSLVDEPAEISNGVSGLYSDREDDVDRPGHRLDHRPVRGPDPQARRRHDRPRPRAELHRRHGRRERRGRQGQQLPARARRRRPARPGHPRPPGPGRRGLPRLRRSARGGRAATGPAARASTHDPCRRHRRRGVPRLAPVRGAARPGRRGRLPRQLPHRLAGQRRAPRAEPAASGWSGPTSPTTSTSAGRSTSSCTSPARRRPSTT